MTIDAEKYDPAAVRRTPRQEDGAIYKAMAFVAAFLVVVPLLYALVRQQSASIQLICFVSALFVFDAGWDLAVLGRGRADMLTVRAPRAVIGQALVRAMDVGLILLVFELPGALRFVAAAFLAVRTMTVVLQKKNNS